LIKLFDDLAVFHDIETVGQRRGKTKVLLDQHDGVAPGLQCKNHFAQLLHDDGRQAFGDFIEQQMLAVARILRTGARLLLLDEISEGLAPVIVQKLGEMILTLKARGYTIVLVEQNFRFAAPLADRFYVMEHGQIVKQFAQDQLSQNMGMLQEYLGV